MHLSTLYSRMSINLSINCNDYVCIHSVVANGDVLNPAVRFLVPNRLLNQFERILEMITEKMGLRILGGVRRYQHS